MSKNENLNSDEKNELSKNLIDNEITDSNSKGTMVISCFHSTPSFPIIEIDPLLNIRYMSPLYHNNKAK